MSKNNSPHIVVLLSTLPVMLITRDFESSVLIAALFSFIWWMTAIFFRLFQNWFPKTLFRLAVVLWFAMLAQMSWYAFQIVPFWVVGLYLFTAGPWKEEWLSCSWSQVVAQGLGFLIVFIVLAAFQDFFYQYYAIRVFDLPAGFFLLLAASTVVWRHYKVKLEL